MNPCARERRAALQTEQHAEWNPSSTGADRLGSARRGVRKRPSWRLVGGNSSLVLIPIDHRSNHLLSGMRGECTVFARPLSLSFSVSLLFSLYLTASFYLLSFFRLLGLLLLTLNQPYTLLAATILQIFVHRFYTVHRRSGSGKVAALHKHGNYYESVRNDPPEK